MGDCLSIDVERWKSVMSDLDGLDLVLGSNVETEVENLLIHPINSVFSSFPASSPSSIFLPLSSSPSDFSCMCLS